MCIRLPPSLKQPAPAPPGTHPLTPAITQRFPQVKLPPDNPLTREGVALGRQLFHDTRLSINGTQSCASCHDQTRAFADRAPLQPGGASSKPAAATPCRCSTWPGSQAFFWDGRAPTLREQVLMPIQDKNEMNETLPNVVAKLRADKDCRSGFAQAFGSPKSRRNASRRRWSNFC
jgi:cytochrome c peroxidase